MTTGLNLNDGLLFFNGREIGEVYECDDSTRNDPTYSYQLYGAGGGHKAFTSKEAAEQSLMDDAVAWLWQLNGELSAYSVIDALRLVLPMAKAYAAHNSVGSNQENVDWAAMVLEDADEVLNNEKSDAKRRNGTEDEKEVPW